MNPSASSALQALTTEYWHALMERQPSWATQLAYHEHDSKLEDMSQASLHAWAARIEGFLSRAESLDRDGLSERERVTLEMLREDLGITILAAGTGVETWSVDQLGGPQVAVFDLTRVHAVTDAKSAATWRDRVRAMPRMVDQVTDNLRLGIAAGRFASRATVARVLEQLDESLARDPATWPVVTATTTRPADMSEADWTAHLAELATTATEGLKPAFERHRALIVNEIAPRARAVPGLTSLPGGDAVYRAYVRLHLGLDETPDSLHERGLAEVARIRADMQALCEKLMPGKSLAEALRVLREDPAYSFGSREEIVEAARAAIRRATAAAKQCFDLLPDHECAVRPVDAHAEKSSPAAFYMAPAPDGARPGTYFVNTSEPQSRPRHEAEVVAFHEAVPGHHLQIALAQKMDAPEFQRHGHNTAYVEGWALYTERLANELGLYSGTIDLLGMLSCDALRACRLVVDTGLHARGWSREQAIAYMTDNTTNSIVDIRNEVDRYIAWPGQALSYKVGQLEIIALRERAERELGAKFRLGAFHAAVLEHGGVTLPVLRGIVDRYIAAARA